MGAATVKIFLNTLHVTLYSEPSTIDVSPSHCQSCLTSTPSVLCGCFFHVIAASNKSKSQRQREIERDKRHFNASDVYAECLINVY